MYVLCRVNFKPFYHTKDMMTVIFIDMVDNCLLSKSSDKDVHSPFARSFKSRSFTGLRDLDQILKVYLFFFFQAVIVF